MNRQEIINALENKGYTAKAVDVSKNNVIMAGIQIIPIRTLSPIIYTDDIITHAEQEKLSVEAVADEIINIYQSHNAMQITENFTSPDYIREHVRIALQRATQEDIIKKACPLDAKIEEFLYVPVTVEGAQEKGQASFKINAKIMDLLALDENELWTCAENNTFADTTITNMLCVLMGISEEQAESIDCTPLYICRAGENRGASAMLDKKALKAFADRFKTDRLIVIPSSVHECIITPYSEEFDIKTLTEMIKDVNNTTVAPVDQLSDKAYIINI